MNNNNTIHIVITIILVQLSIQSIWGQQAETSYIYNKYGDKIVYTCVDNIFHIGFLSGSSMTERELFLADLSSNAGYCMLPDSSYCFTVDSGFDTQFKTKVFANSHVAYCQNEYRDSLGGVVWGDYEVKIEN